MGIGSGSRGAAAALVAGLLVGWSTASADAQDVKDINVGVIGPLSGPVMVNAQPAVNSIKMAVEEVNAEGVMIDGERYRFNLTWFASECDPSVAIDATRAALAQEKPLHVLWAPLCSASAVAIRPLLLEAKVVAINSSSGTSRFVGPKGDPYLFKIKETFDWRTQALVDHLEEQGYKTGVIIAVNNEWGNESSRIFTKHAEEAGIEIVSTLSYDENTEDFIPLLEQAREADPDFIFQASELFNEQVGFLRAYSQLGLDSQLVGESTWTEDVPQKAGSWEAIDGMLTSSAWIPSNPRPAVQEYVAKYQERFGATPGFNGPAAYDAVYITKQAFEKAGSLDVEALREVLRTETFENLVYGTGTMNFDDSGQAQFPVTVSEFDAETQRRVPVEAGD